MASSNTCWGVEIGAGAIKAIKLEMDDDRAVATDFAVIPHAKVLSTPEIDESDVLRLSLSKLVASKDLSNATLAISIPGHQSFARFAKLPPVDPKTVKSVVGYEAQQQIPFPLDEVEWDYQTFQSPDSPEVEVGIFAVARARIMERLQSLNDIGLTPEIATLSPVAAYNAMAHDLEFTAETPGTIVLDIGTTATDLIVAEKGVVWIRTFPIGGHQFTEALVSQFKLSYSKAERLKKEAEQSKHARHVFQAMRPVFTELVQEVQRSIGFYQSMHEGADLKRLIGVGSTLKLPGLRKYLKQQLQMDVYRLESFKRISVEDQSLKSEFDEASINLLTAAGLALQGLGEVPLRANVMPVGVIRESLWKRKRGWFGLAAGVAAATAAAAFVRPVLDNAAFSGSSVPPEVSRAVRTASQLRSEAEQAGVIGGPQRRLEAAQILDLFGNRDVFELVLADASSMLASASDHPDASDVPGDGVVAELLSIEPRYSPGTGGGGPGAAPAGRGRFGGGTAPSSGFSPGGGGAQAGGQTGGQAVDLSTTPHVKVTVRVRSDHPDPEAFASRSMLAWLEANAERENIRHRLVNPAVSPADPAPDRGGGRTPAQRAPRAGEPSAARALDDLAPLRPESEPAGTTGSPGRTRGPARGAGPGRTGGEAPADILEITWAMVLDSGQTTGGVR